MTTDKSIARLKEASRTRNVNEFCALIGPLLRADFGRWLEILREQRLLENFRDRAHIEAIRIALFSALTDQPEHFLRLSIHLDVCLLAQRVFDWIDAETKAISAEPLNEDRYKDTIIRISEVVFEAEGRNIESQIAAGLKPTGIHQFMGAENFLRNTADICNVLLNSPYPVRSRVAAKELPDDPDFDRLISLARTYLSVKGVFDMYTYGHIDVAECTAGSVKFVDRILLRATARAVAAERNGSNDNARMHPLNFVSRELEKNLSEPSDDEDFQDFLSRQEGLFPLLQRLAEVTRNDLVWEVEQYFDTGTMIDRNRGITVRELIDCWAVLRVISNLVTHWQHGRTSDVVRSKAVAHLRRSLVVKAVQQFATCSGAKARALVRRFQEKANKRSVDLFFTPLVLTAKPAVILLGSRFITGGRFERNLFSILVSDGVVDQDAKGFRPVSSLISSFEAAGFLAIGDLPIVQGGKVMTDVDVVAYKEGILFLAQAKVVIEPDTIYEGWKAEKRLEHAAEQLRSSIPNQGQIVEALQAKYSRMDVKVTEVFPFILTNTRQFTELTVGGFPVVDLPYVEFILGGAKATEIVLNDSQIGISSGKSFISGEFPTALEFQSLMTDTLHQVKKRFKQKGTREIKIGDFQIVAPTTELHPPPHPFMKILSDQDMENFMSGKGLFGS